MASQRQKILDYLKDTAFASITIGSGYNFTPATRERGLRSYKNMGDHEFPALFIASADEDRENVTNKDFMSLLNVFIVGMVKQTTNTLIVQIELDKLIEDLTKALYQDPTQGGNAAWTEIKTILTDQGDKQPHAQFSMLAVFRYKSPGTAP